MEMISCVSEYYQAYHIFHATFFNGIISFFFYFDIISGFYENCHSNSMTFLGTVFHDGRNGTLTVSQ